MEDPANLAAARRRLRTEQILESVRRMIAERGLDNVNMRDLAEASQVSVPTLYKLCGDKETILARAMEDQFSRILADVTFGNTTKAVEKYIGIVTACGVQTLRLSGYSREIIGLVIASGGKNAATEQMAEMLARDIASVITEMQSDGQIESWVDPKRIAIQIATHIIACCFGWYSGNIDTEALVPSMVYSAAVMLLGVSRGRSREILEQAARETQEKSGAYKRSGSVFEEGRDCNDHNCDKQDNP